ncbi:MAG: tetratricopeptide repeat protein, partial [Candidatus Kariarchaeaceae archaeon]
DTLQLAFEGYYVPEIFRVEAADARVDRAHNNLWDRFVSIGLLGVIAQYGLYASVFFLGLKWLEVLNTPRDRTLFLVLILAGGGLGSFLFVRFLGMGFLGLGFPIGIVAGVVIFLAYRALHPTTYANPPTLAPWQAVTLIGMIAMMACHFTEILFGIPIVSTLVYFWSSLGVIVVVGWVISELKDTNKTSERDNNIKKVTSKRHRKKRTGKISKKKYLYQERWKQVWIQSILISIFLVTLGFVFIVNFSRATTPATIIANSFTILNFPEPHTSYAIFGLIIITAIIVAVLSHLDHISLTGIHVKWGDVLTSLGFSFIISGVVWIQQANQLARITLTQPSELDLLVNHTSGIITWFYFWLLVVVLFWAFFAVEKKGPMRGINGTPLAILGYLVLPSMAIFFSFSWNLKTNQADMVYTLAQNASNNQVYPDSFDFYRYVLEMAPNQYIYQLFAGKAYYEAAQYAEPPLRIKYSESAVDHFTQAEEINPMLIDNTINLARAYRSWAGYETDSTVQTNRLELADEYYTRAVGIKPSKLEYWREWAELKLLMGDYQEAEEIIEMAKAVDLLNAALIYGSMGDFFYTDANEDNDSGAEKEYRELAIQAYQSQVEIYQLEGHSIVEPLLKIGNLSLELDRYEQANEAYLQVLELDAGERQWQVYRVLAVIAEIQEEYESQRRYLEEAILVAPEEEKDTLQSMLDALDQ